jgi:hypothetical protein
LNLDGIDLSPTEEVKDVIELNTINEEKTSIKIDTDSLTNND